MTNSDQIFKQVKRTTRVPSEGIKLNVQSIDHIINNKVNGAIVECGVWKGGSMAAMLYRLVEHNDVSRDVYLFDTFAGMTEPTEVDIKNNGMPALPKFEELQKDNHNEWCYASLECVESTLQKVAYPEKKIKYVVGDVTKMAADCINEIDEIAILRVDVDFYEATKSCFEELYPKVVSGGIIISDDYGIWEGAQKAIDEYMEEHHITTNLQSVKHLRWFYKD